MNADQRGSKAKRLSAFICVHPRLNMLLPLFLTTSAWAQVDFQKQIQPILAANCIACHSDAKAAGGLRLSTRSSAQKALVGQSTLLARIEMTSDQAGSMPPGGRQLPREQRDLIRQWISEGATWPENIVLGAAPKTAAKDDEALIGRVRTRILASTKEKSQADMKPYKTIIPNTDVTFAMTPIPGGEFTMGTPESERGHRKDESPQHKVKLDPFWMQTYEVTWDEYRLFMFANQAGEKTNQDELVDAVSRPTKPYVEMSFGMGLNGFPAISMTQHAANKYAEWLSAKTGRFYRLPTEAEWEYACRAGTTTAYSFGDDPSALKEYAWDRANSDGKYQLIGKKKPNPWGLYDMHGNVAEWTLDQYLPDAYAKSPAANPWERPTKPYPQTVRGGSWNDGPDQLRCGARLPSDATWKQQDPQIPKSIWYLTDAQWVGFRLVRPLKVPSAKEMYLYWNNGVEHDE
jgi:formylglycine-generating enzyme required for sulfatase activity